MMSIIFERMPILFKLSLISYGVSFFVYIFYFLRRKWIPKFVPTMFFLISFLLNLSLFISTWINYGHPPIRTLFETLIFFSLTVAFLYILIEFLTRLRIIGIFASAFSFLALFYALFKADIDKINLPAALQSFWFIPHVIIYFIAYSALFISFVSAILYLIFPQVKELPEGHWLQQKYLDFDKYTYKIIQFGFIALTLGLLIGGVWAKGAWGDYWGWDPKENWSLITWLIYLIYLHLRFVKGWRGKKAAYFAILGFLAVIMTYLGVNILPTAQSSLHTYQ
ncbi:MAG: c-type cytochrome biogenesis protein CcsB [Candidatus Aminicenantia bacterium]